MGWVDEQTDWPGWVAPGRSLRTELAICWLLPDFYLLRPAIAVPAMPGPASQNAHRRIGVPSSCRSPCARAQAPLVPRITIRVPMHADKPCAGLSADEEFRPNTRVLWSR